MKIVLIGAGSKSFGRGQVVDILSAEELAGRNVELALVDQNEDALALMTKFAERIKIHTKTDIHISKTTNRCDALPGASYVLTAVARERARLWEQDFRVPLSYGFRHCLGENGGPGAAFHALRSLELMIPICRDMELLCPEAWLFNFTNPESRVLHAVCHLTKVKAAGFCHGVAGALEYISRILTRPINELDVVSAGINHFYAILRIADRKTGEDLLPQALGRACIDPNAPPLFRKIAEVFGVITFPSDDHIGEYLSFGSEYSGIKWHYGLESNRVSLTAPSQTGTAFEDFANGTAPLDNEITQTTGELTVPAICDIELDRNALRAAVNVLNTGNYIENLPVSAAVEIPATIDKDGLHPVHVGAIPEPFAAYMRTQTEIVELITEAYRTGSRKVLLQALLLDPVVNGISAAEKMMDDMLELQKDFLPKLT
jgi:alpha-galactosidase